MGHSPSDEQIVNFVSFTGADQRDAIAYLTREPNFEKAVQNYYDAQERGITGAVPEYPAAWNENEMHAGKEYGPETRPPNSQHPEIEQWDAINCQVGYQIHSVDNAQTLGPEIFNSTLSRPPSRVDVKFEDKEDTDLQHGLINSMSSSRHEANTVAFGPATRDYYPPNQWSITTTSHRVLPDPEPKQRARMLGSPAFIKPTAEENRVPNLLTIFQQIPLARETLLLREHVRPEYGTSKDWWHGEPIRSRGAIVTAEEYQPLDNQTPTIDEVQRLMAFLELTERAYGSSDALREVLESSQYRPWNSDNDVDCHLLSVWRHEYKEIFINDSSRDIFTTTATERTNGEITDESNFQIFKLSIQYAIDMKSLYDLIDEVLWGSWVVDGPTEVFINPGDILTFQMTQNSRTNGIIFDSLEWPLMFYTDRYLEENKDKVLKMLYSQASVEEERNDLQVQQTKLEHVFAPSISKSIAATELLKVVKPFLDGERPPPDELDRRDETVTSGANYHPLREYQLIGKDLERVADSILRKHEALEQAKTQLDAKRKVVTDFLKEPSSSQTEDNPVHRYTLRGISTDQNTTFVLANPNTTDDLLDTEINSWDWWRIHWDAQKENPIDLQKVLGTDVVEAARKATDITAVYASDKAINYPQQPIPNPLKNFVRADNLHFASEIEHPELSSQSNAEHVEWAHVQGHAFNYNSRSRNSSIDSMQANLDTDMTDSFHEGEESSNIPSYAATPPPIPPRTGEKRKAPERPLVDNLIDTEIEPQESGTINLMDDDARYDQEMQEINSPRFNNLGIVPGGPQSGISDSVGGSATYASEIQMSDIVETQATTLPGLRYSQRTVDPSKISVNDDEDQPTLI